MKKNLIFSIISLILASTLVVFISFAWFTTNSEVNSTTLIKVTGGSKYEYALQTYDTNAWVDVNSENPLSFDKFSPGDSIYLRYKIVSSKSEDSVVQSNLGQYSSTLSDHLTADIEAKEIKLDNAYQVFDIEDNTDSATKTEYPYVTNYEGHTIYNIDAKGNITLTDFAKIENAVVTYDLGSSKENLTPSQLPSYDDLTKKALGENIFDGQGQKIYANDVTYCYFSIVYEDYDVVESEIYDSNDYFIYQQFKVETINIYL